MPVSRARTSAASTPVASRKPAVRSAIGMPPARTGTVSPRDACAVSSPARACATRSYAGAPASGPDVPNELTRPTTSARCAACTVVPVEPEPPRPARAGSCAATTSACRAGAVHSSDAPRRVLRSSDDRALAAVQRDEVAPDAGRDRHHVPVAVARGRLDLDDVGAEVGEEHAAERPRDVLRVLDDAHAFEGERSSQPQPAARDDDLEDLGRAAGDRRADRGAVEAADASLERRRRACASASPSRPSRSTPSRAMR